MSDLHHTLFVVSCLAALGLGLSAGLLYCYYAHWKPTIRAYQAALRDIHRLTRREVLPEDEAFWADMAHYGWGETWADMEPEESRQDGWDIQVHERLRMIARRTV